MIHTKLIKIIFLTILMIVQLKAHQSTDHQSAQSVVLLTEISKNNYNLVIMGNLESMITKLENKDSTFTDRYNKLRALSANDLLKKSMKFVENLPSEFKFSNNEGKPLNLDIRFENLDITENIDLSSVRNTKITYNVSSVDTIQNISFSWDKALGDTIFRVFKNDELLGSLFVEAGINSQVIKFNDTNPFQNFLDYIVIGFEHILPLGADHILFVIGLYLLSQKLSALLWQVTVFTVAHTITLAIATLGIFTLPGSIVEPLIAASIVFIAIENLFHHHITKLRIIIVFIFGLLHGMGFAGVLGEIGLNSEAFISSLIAFNVGVELGQLTILIGMFVLFQSWLGKTKYWENFFRIPVSVIIASIGLIWLVERIS